MCVSVLYDLTAIDEQAKVYRRNQPSDLADAITSHFDLSVVKSDLDVKEYFSGKEVKVRLSGKARRTTTKVVSSVATIKYNAKVGF